jgi:hypothetical protein
MSDAPGFRKSKTVACAKSYNNRKFKYENFDNMGSTRVVVQKGYELTIWDYWTKRAVESHKWEQKVGTAILIAELGLCLVKAFTKE